LDQERKAASEFGSPPGTAQTMGFPNIFAKGRLSIIAWFAFRIAQVTSWRCDVPGMFFFIGWGAQETLYSPTIILNVTGY